MTLRQGFRSHMVGFGLFSSTSGMFFKKTYQKCAKNKMTPLKVGFFFGRFVLKVGFCTYGGFSHLCCICT